jgi:Glyoxalase-like domain
VSAAALDHVGVVTRDLADTACQYERLGFTVAPFARSADSRIGNRCAMLRRGYIELTAIADASRGSATLDRFLARYAGTHIIALAIADEESELQRLARAGMKVTAASFERSVEESDANAPRARFKLIAAPEQPEGRINLVRHLTPELLWQEKLLAHANNAVALEEVLVATAAPAEAAARFSRIAGCPVVPHSAGGFGLELKHGRVRLLTDATAHVLPRISGVTLRTSDANAAISRIVTQHGISHRAHDGALVVDADEAAGTTLRFVA